MKIAIASDHGGYALKEILLQFLKQKNVETLDLGTGTDDSVDYPDFAIEVASRVSEGKVDAGVLVCGTGIGMAIAANKFPGVRAAVVTDPFTAKMSKEHNNANVIALGGRVVDEALAKACLEAWLDAKYEGGRHQRRLDKISDIEGKTLKKP